MEKNKNKHFSVCVYATNFEEKYMGQIDPQLNRKYKEILTFLTFYSLWQATLEFLCPYMNL